MVGIDDNKYCVMFWLGYIVGCIVVGAILEGLCDVVQFRWRGSMFSRVVPERVHWWFDASVSWENKYEDRDFSLGRRVWFRVFGVDVLYPVQLSDFWHFAKMLRLLVELSVPASGIWVWSGLGWYWWFVMYLGVGVMRNSVFSLVFNNMSKRKK